MLNLKSGSMDHDMSIQIAAVRNKNQYFVFVIVTFVVIQMYISGNLSVPGAIPTRDAYRPSASDLVEEVAVQRTLKRAIQRDSVLEVEEQAQALLDAQRHPHVQEHTRSRSDVKILRGGFRSTEGYLTIGLSSVPRSGASYLIDTLESLFSRLTEPQKSEVVVVLYLGSQDAVWINKTLNDLDGRFVSEMDSSLLQVIQPNSYIYPNFSSVTKRNFGDDLDRVRWRTKQNVDFAHLFYHCRNISKYYIQIEDDVLVASDFLNDIKSFVVKQNAKNSTWFAIEFSILGFIGKMFHSKHLEIIKEYLLMFKEEQPCDLLINLLKRVMVQPKDIRSRQSLFQHIGQVSSLTNKTQKLTDKYFKDKAKYKHLRRAETVKKNTNTRGVFHKQFTIPNPPAIITTTMEVYKDYKPEKAYIRESTFFWGKEPKNGDYIEIKLDKLTNITGIVVNTGHPRLHSDKLQLGEIRLAHGFNEDNDCDVDKEYRKEFSGNFQELFEKPRPIICAVIVVKEDQKSWLIVNEIELRTSKLT